MSTQRQPRGIPAGGQFAANSHDESAPLAPESTIKAPDDIKVGDIVWDGDTGFRVSQVTSEMRWQPDGDKRHVVLHSSSGDFWSIRSDQSGVIVLRDEDVLSAKYESEEY